MFFMEEDGFTPLDMPTIPIGDSEQGIDDSLTELFTDAMTKL